MAAILNGTSQYFSASSTLLSNEPISVIAHVYSNSLTTEQIPVSLANNGSNGLFGLYLRGTIPGDPVAAVKNSDSSESGVANTTSAYPASTWFIAACTFATEVDRSVYINGVSKGTSTISVPDPTPDFITVGAYRSSSITGYLNGRIAEVYVLDAVQTDSQHAVRAKGYSPLWDTPVKNVRAWYPLHRTARNNIANGYPDLTAFGSPSFGDHPNNVIYPRINGIVTM